jgi:ABC-type multidrug transport system ATPase subunit
MEYAIETVGLTKIYKGYKAVNNLTIHVPKGKIYGFLGKNGAGKTTTIRMIMGLIKPNSGKIKIFGREIVNDHKWAAMNIGSIVETPGFYENLTAKDNLAVTAELYGIDKRRIEEVLDIVELKNIEKKKVKEFSLGMKQRLGIANALIHSPGILILDEPTNGLDPAGIKEMREFLKKLSVEQGISILISSHILSEIQLLADYIGIIDQGSLIEETDINAVASENQSYLQIEVDKPEEAVELLSYMKIKYKMEDGKIKVYCDSEKNAQINRSMVMKGLNVSSLTPVFHSLEERFLTVTSDKSA